MNMHSMSNIKTTVHIMYQISVAGVLCHGCAECSFWVVEKCCVGGTYYHFGGRWCLCLSSECLGWENMAKLGRQDDKECGYSG